MNKTFLILITLFSITTSLSQDISGTWNGKLGIDQEQLNIRFNIQKRISNSSRIISRRTSLRRIEKATYNNANQIQICQIKEKNQLKDSKDLKIS